MEQIYIPSRFQLKGLYTLPLKMFEELNETPVSKKIDQNDLTDFFLRI